MSDYDDINRVGLRIAAVLVVLGLLFGGALLMIGGAIWRGF